MNPLTEQDIRRIIRDELQSFIRSDRFTFEKNLQLLDGRNIQVAIGTGTKIGTASTQKLGFWGVTPLVQPTNGVDLTNAVTSGGTTDQIDDVINLSVYATDAPTIRSNFYQLARKLKIVNDALRDIGIMS